MIAILIVLAAILVACGGGGGGTGRPQELHRPAWWGQQTDPEFIFIYSSASGPNERAVRNQAQSVAMSDAALAVEARVSTMMRDFMQEAGVNNPEMLSLTQRVTEAVAATRFRGAMITNESTVRNPDGNFQVFVQYRIPASAVNGALAGHVRNEEALYNEFKATQGFQALEAAVNRAP